MIAPKSVHHTCTTCSMYVVKYNTLKVNKKSKRTIHIKEPKII